MTKASRNAPCPCGSGKKYKRCCLSAKQTLTSAQDRGKENTFPKVAFVEDDGLEELSNRVVDLINEGRLDEAQAACLELKEKFPQTHDWLEREAMVQEARGEYAAAARNYRKAAEFVHNMGGSYDPEIGQFFEEQASVMEEKARQNKA